MRVAWGIPAATVSFVFVACGGTTGGPPILGNTYGIGTCVLPATPAPTASPSTGVSPIVSTPKPTYTAVPATPTPGPLRISPNSLTLSTTGYSNTNGSFAACENLYVGTLIAASENPSVATVSTAPPVSGSSAFNVTSTSSSPGTTLIDVVDSNGNRAALTVNVAPMIGTPTTPSS